MKEEFSPTSTSSMSCRLSWAKSNADSWKSLEDDKLPGCPSGVPSSATFCSLLCPNITLKTASSEEAWSRALVDAGKRLDTLLELGTWQDPVSLVDLATAGSLDGVCCPGTLSVSTVPDELPARSVETARLSQAVRTSVSRALVFGALLDTWYSESSSSSEEDEAVKDVIFNYLITGN